MDQGRLYERHADHLRDSPQFDETPAERDLFIIDELSRRAGACHPHPLKVAELSIGDGLLTRALCNAISNLQLTCCDISPTRIKFVRRLIGPHSSRVEFLQTNLDTEFSCVPDASFDAVVAIDILEHLFDVFGFVSNCQRVLVPGGCLILRVPNIAYVKHRIALAAGRLPITASWFGPRGDLQAWRQQFGWDGGHLHYFTLPLLREVLEHDGLKVEWCGDPGTRYSWLRRLLPAVLCGNLALVARKC